MRVKASDSCVKWEGERERREEEDGRRGVESDASPNVATHCEREEEIGTILCAEHWCCLSSLLGYWAQSWTGRHSNTVY